MIESVPRLLVSHTSFQLDDFRKIVVVIMLAKFYNRNYHNNNIISILAIYEIQIRNTYSIHSDISKIYLPDAIIIIVITPLSSKYFSIVS